LKGTVEHQEDIMEDKTKMIGGAFLIGGALGAVVALLYAPKAGRETRQDITKAALRVKDNAVELIEETLEEVNEFAGALKEKTTAIIGQGMDMSERAKREILATIEQGQKRLEKQKKRLTGVLGLKAL
jgi:gas vesicle protein